MAIIIAEEIATVGIVQKESNNLAEIACIYHGAQAVLDSLQDTLSKTKRTRADDDRAFHLTMALDRSLREIGQHAGAI